MAKHLEEYIVLRNEIEDRCGELWKQHNTNMKCASGCSSCCQAFKILPVEHEYIHQKVKDLDIKINHNIKKGECQYLVDNKCAIYEHRPIICRTHGFPLVRLNEELEEYEVSFCHLNFKGVSLDKFNSQNVFFEDTYNSKLFKLNKEYLDSQEEELYDQGQLLELNSTK